MLTRAALAFTALLIALGLPLFIAPWFGWGSPRRAAVTVEVPRGASLAAVARQLERAKLIDAPRQFRILARLFGNDTPVQAGTYRLRPGAAWRDYLKTMQLGRVVRLAITIPEGTPAVVVADRLRAEARLTGPVVIPPEGSVLPETYDFQPGEARAKVLARMQAAMTRTLAAEWRARKASAVVRTPGEAVILASIVEKETGKSSERRLVAGVYSNRLKAGIKLDADPTVIYPLTKGRPLGRRIKRSELAADTGYNTYLKPGLPKGPIANPGRASLAAALDPAKTDALYFVADGTGGHVFASTLAEHNRNVEKWFALRRQRGEM